ncbi:MAG: hypothetical protein ACK55Z_36640 [bacterium]
MRKPKCQKRQYGGRVEEEVSWMEDGLRMERRRIPRESRERLRQVGREGTSRSEKAKVSEEALLTRSSKAKKPMNA